MSKHQLTAAEDKLLMKGFDSLIDANGYDPSWDEADVLKYLEQNPGETVATKIARAVNIPVHRVIAARNRLEAANKIEIEKFSNLSRTKELETNYLKLVSPPEVCSTGNNETVATEEPLTVITLWQPWATLLIKGVKVHETRSWYTSHRGKILIHAAKRKINWDELDIEALEEIYPDVRNWDYPLGAIVGEAELVECRQCGAVRVPVSESDRLCGNWKDGRFAWEMRNVKPLLIPNVRGKQGLWKYELKVDDVVLGETSQSDETIKPDIPHWLNGRNAAEAKALIDLGFWCVGSVDNWGEPESEKIVKVYGDWTFNHDYGGTFIEARVNGAVFNLDVYENTEEQDKELVNKAIATIKKAAEDWGDQFGQQLTIFDCEQSQNREQSILLTEPPRLIDANGQLSIFFDDSEEPPDPDDFKTLAEYEEAYEQWSIKFPELAEAVDKPVLGETPYQFQKGDRVQKISNPQWIGEIKSITDKGAKIRTPLAYEYMADLAEYRLFSKANSEEILGEPFFNIGDKVKTSDSNFHGKVFTVNKIYSTGMIGVVLDNLSYSYPSMYLHHHVEKIESKPKSIPLEQPKRKRPQKGCGSGYLKVREANKKRNAAKGKDPDVYYVYYYSYSNQYGKEIKSSISVPRAKIAQVKQMVEDKEHYVKIAKFLGKSLPLSY